MTEKDEFELVTASFNDKDRFEPVSTTRKNQFWASDNQFQQQWKTSLS